MPEYAPSLPPTLDDLPIVEDLPDGLACALDLTIEEFTQLHHLLTRIRGAAAPTTI